MKTILFALTLMLSSCVVMINPRIEQPKVSQPQGQGEWVTPYQTYPYLDSMFISPSQVEPSSMPIDRGVDTIHGMSFSYSENAIDSVLFNTKQHCQYDSTIQAQICW